MKKITTFSNLATQKRQQFFLSTIFSYFGGNFLAFLVPWELLGETSNVFLATKI